MGATRRSGPREEGMARELGGFSRKGSHGDIAKIAWVAEMRRVRNEEKSHKRRNQRIGTGIEGEEAMTISTRGRVEASDPPSMISIPFFAGSREDRNQCPHSTCRAPDRAHFLR